MDSGSSVELSDKSRNCKVTRLSHEILCLLSTDIVILTVNAHIESIDPGVLQKLCKLQYLCLARNCIKRISSNIFLKLTHLKKLDLGYNRIE